MNSGLPITFRPMNENDFQFILATWSKEFHKVVPTNFIPNSIYFPHQKKLIGSIIDSNNVVVAHLDEEPDNIVGYIVAKNYDEDNLIMHWCHVKSIFRRQGVAKELLNCFEYSGKNIVCSHYFQLFKKLKDQYSLVYDPTILEEYK